MLVASEKLQSTVGPLIPSEEIVWRPYTGKPSLGYGELHLWRVNLNHFADKIDPGMYLSSDEKIRRDRLISPDSRAEFSDSRAALRLIISRYLDVDPKGIMFGYDDNGKPSLNNPEYSGKIYFNLSHTSGWMLLGIGNFAELGVDIEQIRPVSRSWALKHLFSPAERDCCLKLPEDQVDAAFITAWTRKEALGKAAGGGLTEHVLKEDQQKQIRIGHSRNGYIKYWRDPYHIYQFLAAPGLIGAAALAAGMEASILFFEYRLNNDFSNSLRK